MLENGGIEARLIEDGDWGICLRVSGKKEGTTLISWKVLRGSDPGQNLLL